MNKFRGRGRGRGYSNRGKFNNDRGRKRYFHTNEEPNKQTCGIKNEIIDRSPSKDYQDQERKRFRSENVHYKTEKTNVESEDLNEIFVYYEKVLISLKEDVDIESKDIFANNVLEQSKGYEVDLACHSTSSHCIELLLSHCNDPTTFTRFMNAFAERKEEVCTNGNASHITEALIYFSLRSMQDWSSILESNEDQERQKLVSDAITWLNAFGQFCVEKFTSCLQNVYSCHVLTTLIQALGGQYSNESYGSKKSRIHKAQFREEHFGEENKKKNKPPIKHDKIPKFFAQILKKLSQVFIIQENILDIVCESSSATVVESLLTVLKERHPKYCKKMVNSVALHLFAERDNDGTPVVFLHKNSSYVAEKLFESALEKQQEELWHQYFASCFQYLIIHPVANYVVQRLFNVVTSKELFTIMSEEAGKCFSKILDSRCFGVFLSIASACNRLKIQQAQFIEYMMQCLQCYEPEDRQSQFIPLLLGFKKYQVLGTGESSHTDICLQGSLVVQAILKFHKPIKVVKSILNMKPEDLASLASHMQGCHVLTCFFGNNNNVGEKNKDKLINHLKPVLPAIVSDRSGSLTLSRMWLLFSLKQKSLVAQELSLNVKMLQGNRSAAITLQKFGVFHYKKDFDHWKEMQLNFPKPKEN